MLLITGVMKRIEGDLASNKSFSAGNPIAYMFSATVNGIV